MKPVSLSEIKFEGALRVMHNGNAIGHVMPFASTAGGGVEMWKIVGDEHTVFYSLAAAGIAAAERAAKKREKGE